MELLLSFKDENCSIGSTMGVSWFKRKLCRYGDFFI